MVHIDFLILMNTKIIFFISSIYFERQQEIDEFGVVMREEKAFTPRPKQQAHSYPHR